MGQTTFSGPVRSLAGFNPNGYASIVKIPAATTTLDLTSADHGGRILSIDASHTLACELPAINQTDPLDDTTPGQVANYGLTFRIFIGYTVTSLTVNCNGSDEFIGTLDIKTEAAGASDSFFADDSDGSIVIISAATGWLAGGMLEMTCTDLGWFCGNSKLLGSGTPTTPFTA